MMTNADEIVDFYKNNEELLNTQKEKVPDGVALFVPDNCAFINSNTGLGDILSVFHLPKFFKEHGFNSCIHSPNTEYFDLLSKYNKDVELLDEDLACIRVENFQSFFNFGSGHFFQRIQKACGFEIDIKPKPDLSFDTGPRDEGRKLKVAINFEPGACVAEQKAKIHPRARELYPEHKDTIQKFINDKTNEYEFVEIGRVSCEFENVESKCGLPIDKSLEEMASCDYFLGMHSGVMHLAAALNVKSIIILNFPPANQIYLPCLRDYNLPDIDWLYPQNVHLHEDDEGELVKQLSYDNLERAFQGEIYPHWSEKYLELVNDKQFAI
jgi:hypothetical protein